MGFDFEVFFGLGFSDVFEAVFEATYLQFF